MVWIFVSMAAVAITFLMLGAMSVWVSVLSLALKAVLLAGVVVVIYNIVQRYRRRKP